MVHKMKKIVILRCLQSNDVCTGASCLDALYKRKGSFKQYIGEEVELVAFFSCNGCNDCYLNNQKGLIEKLECILKLHPDSVHLGACTMLKDKQNNLYLCEKIKDICCYLEKHNIKIVQGTH